MNIKLNTLNCFILCVSLGFFSCSKKEDKSLPNTLTTERAIAEIAEMKKDYEHALITNPNTAAKSFSNADGNSSVMTVPALPEKIDLTPYFPNVADQDQDHVGSCVSYACSYIKGFQENYERNLMGANRLYTMSAIHLFARVMSTSNACIFGGSNFANNLNQLINIGICLEEDLPYDANKCISKTDARLSLYNWASARFRIKTWRTLALTTTALKTELAKNNPVLLGISVDSTFRYYAGNNTIYNYNYNSNKAIFGHGIACIGYDNTKHAFKLINSYGTGWGDNGYLWISEASLLNHLFAAYALDDAIDIAAGPMICPVRELVSGGSIIYRLSDYLPNGSSTGSVIFKAFDGKNGNAAYTPIYATYNSATVPSSFTKNALSTGYKMFYTKKSIEPGDSPLLKKLYYLSKNTSGAPKLSDKSAITGYTLKEDLGYVIF